MRPARRSAPAALRLPARLAPSLGLLLLRLLWCPHAARGDCGFPPDMPNATVLLENRTIFPVGTIVGYYCNPGFVKIIGKVNVVHCLPNGQWTKPEVFCQRSCGPTPRVPYAHKKDVYIPVSSYPAGFIVEYECNPGFARNHSVSGNVTCLQDYTWSKSEVFCYKKSCPDPGKIENGHIIIPTDILFTSEIYFSCDPGYKLVGVNSTYCDYEGDNMIWENPFPECQEIPTTTQKPSTTDVPSTRTQSTTQRTSSVDVTGVPVIASGLTVGAIIIAIVILTKIYENFGRTGAHIYDIDSFVYDAGSHWLPDLAKEEIRRKCITSTQNILVFISSWKHGHNICSSALHLACYQ
uniref:CD55 molecule (Cromer blood group) n=1 Tax=Pipistrellus kuhlii TaxID=59472 RepID=A0A7J7USJ3_PIPKU|nr:CD55 molecule (Cromer blood group) [Pipistrellus kuhlii]